MCEMIADREVDTLCTMEMQLKKGELSHGVNFAGSSSLFVYLFHLLH